MTSPPTLAPQRDLELGRGKKQSIATDLALNGWIVLAGQLELRGRLTCLGVVVEPGGELRCTELVTNFLEVDNAGGDTVLDAARVHARVVTLTNVVESLGVGRPLSALVESGRVVADYLQHWGGDLNPSWDYVRGDASVTGPAFYERGRGEVVTFDVRAIREAMRRGQAVFPAGPLVAPHLKPAAKITPAPPQEDPLVAELRAWLESHPGPQRATLEALRADWLPRMKSAAAAAKPIIARLVTYAVKSPKLAADRDALLAEAGAT